MPCARDLEHEKAIMKDWLKFVILGGVSVLFGVLALGAPVVASLSVTTLTGILFLLIGALQLVGGASGDEGWGTKAFNILMGALMVFLGWSFVAHPLEGTISLAMLVVLLLGTSGVIRLIYGYRMKQTRFFWPMLITGVLSLLLAGYILANFATASVAILGILLGVELLFNGFGLIVMGLFLRSLRKLV